MFSGKFRERIDERRKWKYLPLQQCLLCDAFRIYIYLLLEDASNVLRRHCSYKITLTSQSIREDSANALSFVLLPGVFFRQPLRDDL